MKNQLFSIAAAIFATSAMAANDLDDYSCILYSGPNYTGEDRPVYLQWTNMFGEVRLQPSHAFISDFKVKSYKCGANAELEICKGLYNAQMT